MSEKRNTPIILPRNESGFIESFMECMLCGGTFPLRDFPEKTPEACPKCMGTVADLEPNKRIDENLRGIFS